MADQTVARKACAVAFATALNAFLKDLDALTILDAQATQAGYVFADGDFNGTPGLYQYDSQVFAAVRAALAQLATYRASGTNTTLGAAITLTTATTITVAAGASGFPTANFFITIDSEQMFVTAVSGTTWTVVRGTGGTVAATHALNAQVFMPTRISTLQRARC